MRIELPITTKATASQSRPAALDSKDSFGSTLSSAMNAGNVARPNDRTVARNSREKWPSTGTEETTKLQVTPQQTKPTASLTPGTVDLSSKLTIPHTTTISFMADFATVAAKTPETQPSSPSKAVKPASIKTQTVSKQDDAQTTDASASVLAAKIPVGRVGVPALPTYAATPNASLSSDVLTPPSSVTSGQGDSSAVPSLSTTAATDTSSPLATAVVASTSPSLGRVQVSAPQTVNVIPTVAVPAFTGSVDGGVSQADRSIAAQSTGHSKPEPVAVPEFTLPKTAADATEKSPSLSSKGTGSGSGKDSKTPDASITPSPAVQVSAATTPQLPIPIMPASAQTSADGPNFSGLQVSSGNTKSIDSPANPAAAPTLTNVSSKQPPHASSDTTTTSTPVQTGDTHTAKIDAAAVQVTVMSNPQSGGTSGQSNVAAPHVDAPAGSVFSKDAATTQANTAQASAHTSPSTPDVDGVELPSTSPIHSSTLMQNISGSEMRVGLHSLEFGGVSIRTSISQQQIVAQISVSNGDLGRALSDQISSVQTKISDQHGLRSTIEVHAQGGSLDANSQSSSRDGAGAYARSSSNKNVFQNQAAVEPVVASVAVTESQTRLDIRA